MSRWYQTCRRTISLSQIDSLHNLSTRLIINIGPLHFQDELYAQLAVHISAAADQQIADTDESCYLTWDDNSMYAVPWDIPADSPSPDYPANCGLYSTMSEIDSAALPAFLAEISIAADPRYIEV